MTPVSITLPPTLLGLFLDDRQKITDLPGRQITMKIFHSYLPPRMVANNVVV
jgi:hypothetical protein